MRLPVFVCLSLSARLLKNACMDLDKMLHVDRCRDMDGPFNFWAGTGLISPISYALQCEILLRRENPTYWAPVAAVRRGFKMVLFTASHGNIFVRGKCALPSALLFIVFFCTLLLIFCIHYIPITSTWPHRRCDAGLEEGEYKYKLSLCYSIVYYYNGAQRYEQFLQASWLYRALILLGLALCLPSTFVSLVFVVLYINFFAYILLFTF